MNTDMTLENDNSIDQEKRIIIGIIPIRIIRDIVGKILSGATKKENTNLSRRRFMGIKE